MNNVPNLTMYTLNSLILKFPTYSLFISDFLILLYSHTSNYSKLSLYKVPIVHSKVNTNSIHLMSISGRKTCPLPNRTRAGH